MKQLAQKSGETELVNRKIDRIEKLVKAGKRKCLSAEQALGKHAQLLKPSFVRKIRKIEKRGRFRRLKSLEELWE